MCYRLVPWLQHGGCGVGVGLRRGGGATPSAAVRLQWGVPSGFDEHGVGDVLDDSPTCERLGGPAADGFCECGGRMTRGPASESGSSGKTQRCIGAGSLVGRPWFVPVDGREDDQVGAPLRSIRAGARGAEVDDASQRWRRSGSLRQGL